MARSGFQLAVRLIATSSSSPLEARYEAWREQAKGRRENAMTRVLTDATLLMARSAKELTAHLPTCSRTTTDHDE